MVYLLSPVSSKLFMKWFALFCLLALWAVSADAATYYVRPGGSDSHSCSQAQTNNDANAKATIQNAMTYCPSAGDTIIVHGGTYATYSTQTTAPTNRNGTSWDNAITLRAAPDETVWLRGQLGFEDANRYWIVDGINVDGGDVAYWAIALGSASFIRLQNLEVKNAQHTNAGGCFDGVGCEFIKVRSHGAGMGPNTACNNPAVNGSQCHGFYVGGSSFLIDGVEAYNNEGHGVAAYADGITIRNSKFYRMFRGGGIQLTHGSGRHRIYNNLFYSNAGYGLEVYSRPADLYNNTIYGNGRGAMYLDGHTGSVVRNNIMYNTGGKIDGGASFTSSHNLCNTIGGGCTLAGDPKFANASGGDFRVQVGSPAIDKGMAVSQVTTDFDKNPRPQGPRFTIGAYEYTDSAPRPLSTPTRSRTIKR